MLCERAGLSGDQCRGRQPATQRLTPRRDGFRLNDANDHLPGRERRQRADATNDVHRIPSPLCPAFYADHDAAAIRTIDGAIARTLAALAAVTAGDL